MPEAMSRFPPTFDGNPWSYGFALFSLSLISAISLSLLLHFAFETRRHIAVQRMLGCHMPAKPALPWSLLAFRGVLCGLLMTIVFGALPDVLVMLAWGEATDRTMEVLFLIDRVLDGMTLLPFAVSVAFVAWGMQSNEQLMMIYGDAQLPPFTFRVFRRNAAMIALVLLIAVGVTLGKASA